MVDAFQHGLAHSKRNLVTVAIVVGFLLVEAAVGRGVRIVEAKFVVAAALALVGGLAVLGKLELGIALLGALSMYGNPTVFDVQGREIDVIHLLGALVVVAWLLRRLLVERSLRLPRSQLNAPLLALLLIWPLTWLAGYIFWDARIPTTHRQPLFFVAEYGQLLLFAGLFWTVADTVVSERWAKIICAVIIIVNASTVLTGLLGWNQTPVALALICSLLAFGQVDAGLKVGLWLVLGIFLWGLIGVNRIPIYLAAMAVMFVAIWLKSKRLAAFMLAPLAIVGALFIKPLWEAEGSVSSRLQLARLALSVFQDRPLLGIGPTHYRSYAILYHRDVSYGWHTVESGHLLPHNMWLYHLANVGAVGFVGILWLVGAMIAESLAAFHRAQDSFSRVLAASALACVTGVLVQSVGGHMGFLPNYNLSSFYMAPVWILMGLLAARRNRTIEGQQDG